MDRTIPPSGLTASHLPLRGRQGIVHNCPTNINLQKNSAPDFRGAAVYYSSVITGRIMGLRFVVL